MTHTTRSGRCAWLFAAAFACLGATLHAQAPGAPSKIDSGDNAWMLTSAALVLMMTGPGLALFYGGLVRTKNVLATMMQSFFLISMISLLWFLFGYGAAFGKGNAFIGNPLSHLFLHGVGAAPDPDYAPTIPAQTFMVYQMMFAIITPGLITGAFAERMRFSAYVAFTALWTIVVYFPLAHMVWGKGGFFNWELGGHIPVLDFAGGTVVHISSGVSALVCAIVLGPRRGFPREPMLPHNVVLSLIGTGLLWVGWFGFNAGSALASGALATSAFAATHFAGAAGGFAWSVGEWIHKGKPSVLGTASGMVAGLATITPASGFVTVPSAVLIGLAGGFVCYLCVTHVKTMFGYDDSLDVFGVHCCGSIVGMLLLGFLASAEANPAIANTFKRGDAVVSLVGGPGQFVNQLIAVAVTAVAAGLITFVLLKIINAVIGLRVDPESEHAGLDVSEHGENAYNQ
ncbi:ammonium transporter [Chthoniobacter flavus Ellin428]|uniref:Ammonium transporter n=1 Tax=Chthoniobacter flavus Ellin428 TaxID=497964 RepID=B4D7W2_9BACT|nr:ammonium transporter [Chthoniobacter flavus]EDY17485.1 ammonium transporter [Chthoniobacter flavus Ellin428]TCO92281.1 ammonium transporter [Chthoniobacter flavus]